jgi:hypothetical protein
MNSLYAAVLAIIVSLVRRLPQEQAEVMATAISETAQTREEAAMLLTVSYFETGFRSRGPVIPFGLSGAPRACQLGLTYCAGVSLRSLRRAVRCSRQMDRVFGFYHTGRCLADPYSIRQAATYLRIFRRLEGQQQ